MADFVSGFWGWFVAIGSVVSILACFWLGTWLSGKTTAEGEEVKTMGHVWDEDLAELNNPLPRWWLNMFYITLVFALIYLALYPGLGTFKGFLGWSGVSQYEAEIEQANKTYGPLFAKYADVSVADLAKDPEAMKMGEGLYGAYCTQCHGSDARGVPGYPNLTDNDWLWGGSPDAIKQTIMNGRTGMMPPKGATTLDDKGIEEVTQYVLSLSGRETDKGMAAKGATHFAVCGGCHGADGKGNPMLGAPNLTDNIWLYGGSPKRIANSIKEGRSGVMPPHREFLGEDKVHVLSAYIYSLSN